MEHNLKTSSIEIWTDKEVGKTGELSLQFNTEEQLNGELAGGIGINFATKQYELKGCSIWKDIPGASLILTKPRIIVWRITLTYDSNTNVQIHYNDVIVVDVELDDTLCTEDDWKKKWVDRYPAAMLFSTTDTASNGYRPYSTGD